MPPPAFDLSGPEQPAVCDQMPDGKRYIAQGAAGEPRTNPVTLVVNRAREVERYAR